MNPEDYPTTVFGASRRTPGPHGYVAYVPSPIPRELDLPSSIVRLLADAEAALGRLAGIGQLVPNPHLLMEPYLLREALASTRIEGTEASMTDLYAHEVAGGTPNADVEEVLNYIKSIEWGLAELERLPISVRLLREMHRRLPAGVRGRERRPGELRSTQNWIGGAGSTIDTARFVPPPPEELGPLLADWERYANASLELPLLVQDALLHYQFETLHPFLDGNGRLGRLMMVFFLIARGRLPGPLLYLSTHLEQDRTRYYEALQAPRERGDIEPWLRLFLEAVQTQAADAVHRANRILEMRESYRVVASAMPSSNLTALADLVFERPILVATTVMEHLAVTRPTAISLLRQLAEAGILTEQPSGPRGQLRYVAEALLDVLSGGDLEGR